MDTKELDFSEEKIDPPEADVDLPDCSQGNQGQFWGRFEGRELTTGEGSTGGHTEKGDGKICGDEVA